MGRLRLMQIQDDPMEEYAHEGAAAYSRDNPPGTKNREAVRNCPYEAEKAARWHRGFNEAMNGLTMVYIDGELQR